MAPRGLARRIALAALLGLGLWAVLGRADNELLEDPPPSVLKLDAQAMAGDCPPETFKSAVAGWLVSSFGSAFVASLSLIITSELGDKTFFIAAMMAMRHCPWTVFSGALAALGIMTVLSALAGFALPNLFPRLYTHYATIVLFVGFGVRLLLDAYYDTVEAEGMTGEIADLDVKGRPALERGGSSLSVDAPDEVVVTLHSPVNGAASAPFVAQTAMYAAAGQTTETPMASEGGIMLTGMGVASTAAPTAAKGATGGRMLSPTPRSPERDSPPTVAKSGSSHYQVFIKLFVV
eukprot:Selendium_serpulae@DN6383_c0_g2_i11.p2